MNRWHGFICVLIASVAFGIMPIFARLAYSSGINPASLLFFRFSIAAFCMAVILLLRKSVLPPRRSLLILALMGIIGYAGQSFSYFTALTLIPAGLVAILLYLYPVIVMFLTAVLYKEPISAAKLISLVLAVGGAVLLLGFEIAGDFIGVLWGLNAAFIYSLYVIVGSRIMKSTDPFVACTIVIGGASIPVGIMAFMQGFSVPGHLSGWLWIACLAVLCTAFAIGAFLIGLKHVGPVDASLISTLEPVTSVVLASAFLNERISIFQLFGMGMILAATALLTRQGNPRRYRLKCHRPSSADAAINLPPPAGEGRGGGPKAAVPPPGLPPLGEEKRNTVDPTACR